MMVKMKEELNDLEVDLLIYEIVAGDKRKEIEKKGGTGWR
jgi:hypothetical protein